MLSTRPQKRANLGKKGAVRELVLGSFHVYPYVTAIVVLIHIVTQKAPTSDSSPTPARSPTTARRAENRFYHRLIDGRIMQKMLLILGLQVDFIDVTLETPGVASPESALGSIQPFPGRNRQNTPLFTL